MNRVPVESAKSAVGLPKQDATPDSETGSAEKRTAPRLPAAMVPSITGIRLLPDDVAASLVNISASGMLVECVARPKPGTAITIRFSGNFPTPIVQGRVARAMVACVGQDGVLRYHLGIAFNAPIALFGLDEALTGADAETPRVATQGDRERTQARPALRNRW